MIQNKVFLFISPTILTSSVFSQKTDSTKIVFDSFDNYDNLRKLQKESGIDTLTYLDQTYNFQVNVPNWLNLKETGSRNLFGGTMPAVYEIENAILITAYDKSKFKLFDEFKEIYLTGDTIGKPTRYNKELVWFGRNELIKIDNGVKAKVFIFYQNHIYHNQFVLVETKSAYLWIQFTSTQETYEKNISKFDEFMAGFKTTNY